MRPSSLTSPGALLTHRLGPTDPDTTDGPPSPDCCDVDPTNVPDRTAFENGGVAFRLSSTGDAAIIQSTDYESPNSESTATITLDSSPTPGNLLYAAFVMRDGPGQTWPSGWDVVEDVATTGFSAGILEVRTHVVADGSDDSLTITKGGSKYAYLVLAEVSGEFEDSAEVNDAGTSPSSMSVGPATAVDADTISIAAFIVPGIDEVITPGTGYAELEEGQAGAGPTGLVEWDTVAAGAISATASSGSGISTWAAILTLFGPGAVATWTVPATVVIDGDDGTSVDITGPLFLRFDLGAAYRIQRLRYVLGMTNAGSATVTLDGWNETDESDRVTVRSTTFTGTGSLTAQTVTDEWYTAESYRYWEIDGPAEVVRWFTVSLFEGTVQIAHEHPTTVITTDETDTDLVLHPDGSGGVEWGPGGTVDPDQVKDAGRWELAVITGSPPDSLYADGDWLYIWVPGP